MIASIRESANGETYGDVEKLIYRMCWDFHRKYPRLEFDECLSEANLKYCEVRQKHDPNRGRFTTFIYWCVLNALRDLARKHANGDEQVKTLPGDEIDAMPSADVFDLDVLAGELSDDAAFVVRTTTQLPDDPKVNGRKYLVRILRSLDWTATRILESFSEIKEALQ